MAKVNKVCVNIDQTNPTNGGFTDAEKGQARDNIAASQISYNDAVTDMTVTKVQNGQYDYPVYKATIGSDNFLLLPASVNDGTVVKRNGALETQALPGSGDNFDVCLSLLNTISTNTTLLDTKTVDNSYKEYAGNIGFTTSTSTSNASMSICAFNENNQLIYNDQCVNFNLRIISSQTTNFIPFAFKEIGNEKIACIGIKGTSNSNATITHLFYIGKK